MVSGAGRLDFRNLDYNLVIKLGRTLKEGREIELYLSYVASREGFYFVSPDKDYPEKHLEAWTQGETTEQGIGFLASITLGSNFQAKFRL